VVVDIGFIDRFTILFVLWPRGTSIAPCTAAQFYTPLPRQHYSASRLPLQRFCSAQFTPPSWRGSSMAGLALA
jgi:hypothetical protein